MKRGKSSRWLASVLAGLMVLSLVPVRAFADTQSSGTSSYGRCLRIGTIENLSTTDGSIQRYAWARVPIKVTAQNYYLSLDYMAPNIVNSGLSVFRARGKNNTIDVLPQLIRRGANLRVKEPSGTQFDITNIFTANQWVHFDVEVQNGTARIYVNGVPIKKDGKEYAYQVADGAVPDTFGTFGDETSGWYDEYGYYDNLTLTENGAVTWQENFDGTNTLDDYKAKGWVTSFYDNGGAIKQDDAFSLDHANDHSAMQLSSVEATASQTSFRTGETHKISDLFQTVCMTSSGFAAVDGMVKFVASSSDPKVASVSEDGQSVTFLSAGSCNLTLNAEYLGSKAISQPVEFTVSPGNSLRLGSETSNSGYATKQLAGEEAITTSDYYISYDYRNEENRANRNFNIWYAQDADGKQFGPKIYQRGTQLRLTDGVTNLFLDGYDFSKWTNITVHISGTSFELYINGKLLQDSLKYTVPCGKVIQKVGPLGDTSSSWDDGTGEFDNFTVVQNHKTTTFQTFDDNTSLSDLGWTTGGETAGYSPVPVNCALSSLTGLTVSSGRMLFGIGSVLSADQALKVTANLTNGNSIPGGMCELSYTSSDPSVVSVDSKTGEFSFLKSGSATINVSAKYHGTTATGSTGLIVGDGNAVELSTPTASYGCMWRMLKSNEIPTGSDYTVSFDYMPEQATYLDIFYAFDKDGKQVGPRIQQINNDIQVLCGNSTAKLTGVLKYGVWHHFVFRFNNGQFSFWINGVLQKINGADSWTMPAAGQLAKLGPWGDTSNGGVNKNCFYDNVRIIENNKILYEENFNTGSSLSNLGWTTAGEVSYANPPQNTKPAELTSVQAETLQSVFAENAGIKSAEDVVALSGILSSGVPVAAGLGVVTYTSSNPDAVTVTEQNGKPAFEIKNKGKAVITASYDLLGAVKTANFTLYVDSSLKPVSISVANQSTALSAGDNTELILKQQYSNGASERIKASNITGFSVTSSRPDVIAANQENGEWYLNALEPGTSKITISYQLNDAAQESTVSFTVNGACLQTGDGRGNTAGEVQRMLKNSEAITADEYFVSFDYKYPSWAKMYNYYTWYSYDTDGVSGQKGYLEPAILQTGKTLHLYCGLNAPVTITDDLKPDTWYNFTFRFKGNKMSFYMNGVPFALDNGNYWVPRNLIKLPALGWFGDTTWNDVSTGDAYYDNIRVVQMRDGQAVITTDQEFNDTSKTFSGLGWNVSGPAVQITNAVPDSSVGQLDRLTLEGRTGFKPGDKVALSDALKLTGYLDTGRQAVLDCGTTTYTSSDPDILAVTEENGVPYLNALKDGRTELTAETTLLGVTKKTSVDLIVSDTTIITSIQPFLDRGYLIKGENAEVLFRVADTTGNTRTVSASSLPDGTQFVLSSGDTGTTSTEKSGHLTLSALHEGTADLKVSYPVLGKTEIAGLSIPVTAVRSISAQLAKTPLYETDTDDILLTAKLGNGDTVDDLPFTMNCAFSNPDAVQWINQRLAAKVPASNLKIEISVVFGGDTFTTELVTDILKLELSKTRSAIYTTQKVANARENIQKYDWAQKDCANVIAAADKFLKDFSYDDVWLSLTSQGLPRTYSVNESYGCPLCGSKIYNTGIYPWKINYDKLDFKMYCPDCSLGVDGSGSQSEDAQHSGQDSGGISDESLAFPTNDFLDYYKGGLNKYGEFDAKLAKAHNDALIAKGEEGNLVNRYYGKKLSDAQLAKLKEAGISDKAIARITTDKGWGVDDGFGYVDPETGIKYALVADYNHWFAWEDGPVKRGMENLKKAYLYTGEQKYADMLIVILDRMADVYKDMDLTKWRAQDGYVNGVDGVGKVMNSVWECANADSFMLAFDAVYPAIFTMDSGVKNFLQSQSAVQDKTNPVRIVKNFEDNVLRQIVPAWNKGLIHGNEGMHQATVAYAAVILDHYPETQNWLYDVFRSGGKFDSGNFSELLVNEVDHDGQGYESPFYNNGWLSNWLNVADALDGYQLPEGKPLQDNIESNPYKNVKFKKMFYGLVPLSLNDIYIANIGDTTAAGAPYIDYYSASQFIKAFEKYGDTELGQIVYKLNGNSLSGLHSDIFTKDPETIADKIKNIIKTSGTLKLPSEMLSGSGYAVLRDGEAGNSTGVGTTSLAFADMPILSASAQVSTAYPPTVQLNATKNGDEVEFSFNFAGDESKQYTMNIEKWRAGWWGVYDVYLNGVKIKDKLSFVGSGAVLDSLGVHSLKNGTNTLKFICVSTDANCKMGVRFLKLSEYQTGQTSTIIPNTQRDLWMTFSKCSQHHHEDLLNLGLVAYRLDLLPDLGYPLRADSSNERLHWVDGTLSHNTVLVDGKQQLSNYTATPLHFDDSGFVKLMDVDSSRSYESTKTYRRTSAMIRIDDSSSYIVDLFRVAGGNKHEFSFHAGESVDNNASVTGLNLTNQSGTYDGPDTTFGVLPSGENSTRNPGYYWLKDVATDSSPAKQFSVDWNLLDTYNVLGNGGHAENGIHVKLTMLGNYNSVSLASGMPPQKSADSPKTYRYVVVKNEGTNLNSLFTSVIEPYRGSSNIASIEALPVTENGKEADSSVVRAIKVTLMNGRVDYIVNALDSTRKFRVADLFDFSGFFGVYSQKDGKLVASYLNDGTQIGDMTSSVSAVTGKVSAFTKGLSTENYIDIQPDQKVNPSDLAGKTIYVNNDHTRNAVYKIDSAEEQNDGTIRLNIGDVTTVRAWADTSDFSKGFVYDLADNESFRIPLTSLEEVKAAQYSLTVQAGTGGRLESDPSGSYAAGAVIPLKAVAESGYHFKGWSCTAGSVSDSTSLSASFTMPDGNATVTAMFEKTSSPSEPSLPASGDKGGSITPVSPKTGDNSNMILWLVILLGSGVCLAAVAVPYRKRKKYGKKLNR